MGSSERRDQVELRGEKERRGTAGARKEADIERDNHKIDIHVCVEIVTYYAIFHHSLIPNSADLPVMENATTKTTNNHQD